MGIQWADDDAYLWICPTGSKNGRYQKHIILILSDRSEMVAHSPNLILDMGLS